MAELRLELFKKVVSPLLRLTDPSEYRSYKETLTFEGGYAFATATEFTVRKSDGTVFRSSLSHYESDPLFETYLGHFENGKPFRLVMASGVLAQLDPNPTIAIAGLSKTAWAVHYSVKP